MIIGVEILSILDIIYKAIEPFFRDFKTLGLFILGLFIFIELLKSAISLALGNGVKLTYTMLNLIAISMILTAYKPLIDSLWSMAFTNLRIILDHTRSGELHNLADGSMGSLEALWASFSTSFMGGIKSLFLTLLTVLPLMSILFIILLLVNVAFYLVIAGHFFGFMVLLLSGYVFIPCLFSSDLRNVGIVWINNLLVYIATFIGFSIAVQICVALEYIGVFTLNCKFILHHDPSYLLQILLIPLLQITVMLKVPGTISSLIGYGGGAGGAQYGYSGISFLGALGLGAFRSVRTVSRVFR